MPITSKVLTKFSAIFQPIIVVFIGHLNTGYKFINIGTILLQVLLHMYMDLFLGFALSGLSVLVLETLFDFLFYLTENRLNQ